MTRKKDGRAQFALRLEEVNRDVGARVQPMQLEAAITCVAVIVTLPPAPCRGTWAEGNPADDPGIRHRLIIGSENAPSHGDALTKSHVHCQAGTAPFWVDGHECVGDTAHATRVALRELAIADLLEHVIGAGALDGQMPQTRRPGEFERSIGQRLRSTALAAGIIDHAVCEEHHRSARDGMLRAFFGDLAAYQHAARQG